MIKYNELDGKYITDIFPEAEQQINDELDGLNEFLPHIIFGNVLNPIVIHLLKRDDYSENKQLLQVFDMYEDFASGDTETQNLLQVTLLEILWDEAITYERAMELMGEKTKEIWDYIYGYLYIPRSDNR
ncbi:MAG: hypothetical protein J5926_00150 [Ruminococcus sp.]|nr:hypothetical protein [Ruminococcus sp.]